MNKMKLNNIYLSSQFSEPSFLQKTLLNNMILNDKFDC